MAEEKKESKPRKSPGPRFTNVAERIVRLLVELPVAVRTPTVQYALSVAMAAPEPKHEEPEEENQTPLSL